MKIFITGNPGSGKSTILMRAAVRLRAGGLKVGGIITPERRIRGVREGFNVVDLHSGIESSLASIGQSEGPRVGKYRVNVESFENVALPALYFAMQECDVICVDEIGRMEFYSDQFRQKIELIVKSDKPFITAVHRDYVKHYEGLGKIFYVTVENREDVLKTVLKDALELLKAFAPIMAMRENDV